VDIKKMKSQASVTNLVVILLLVMGIFLGLYGYWIFNINNSGIAIDSIYVETSGNVTEAINDLNKNVQDIQDGYQNIKEAEVGFLTAWNGMKSLGSTLKLPITFLDTALTVFTRMVWPLQAADYMSTLLLVLSFIGVGASVLFIALRVLKGEQAL